MRTVDTTPVHNVNGAGMIATANRAMREGTPAAAAAAATVVCEMDTPKSVDNGQKSWHVRKNQLSAYEMREISCLQKFIRRQKEFNKL